MNDRADNNQQGNKKNDVKAKPERFTDQNLDQPAGKSRPQRYDDRTGTVENGIG